MLNKHTADQVGTRGVANAKAPFLQLSHTTLQVGYPLLSERMSSPQSNPSRSSPGLFEEGALEVP